MFTNALLTTMLSTPKEANSMVPEQIRTRIESLLAVQGEAGDHVVTMLFRRLNEIMQIDPKWTTDHLLPMLSFENPAAEPAWNGFLFSNRNPSSELAIALKPLLLCLYPWIFQFDWSQDNTDRAAIWMAWMCVFRSGEHDGLDNSEMRKVLRALDDNTRNKIIFWLNRVGQKNEEGWKQLVIPFINNVWPRERIYRTTASVFQWINLLDDTKDDFPAVYEAVKKFLIPVESNSPSFYRFTRVLEEEEPITVRHPKATLDFLDTITPTRLSHPSYDLPQILSLIEETAPDLTTNAQYLRLIDLVDSS